MINSKNNRVLLIILDGWGYRAKTEHNAIAAAHKPYFDHLWASYPHTLLEASGLAVGLPAGQMGNSEVGHMTIGAGRPIDTDIVRINKAIDSGHFANNDAFTKLFDHVKKYNSVLHIKGLVSPGGIHSHQNHLFAFLKLAKKSGITKVAVHAFLDGRDTPPQAGADYLKELEAVLSEVGIGRIATMSGRYYAMDRDHNWDRLAKVEEAIFKGEANKKISDKPSDLLKKLYKEGKVDEHLEPIVFLDESGRACPVQNNDGIFFFNFRSDRARMLSKKIIERREAHNLFFVSLTEYDTDIGSVVAFPPVKTEATLAGKISNAGLKQVHIAETEKYAHATYFLNVGRETPYPGEEQIMVKSRSDIKTHDEAPEMRAAEVADEGIKAIKNNADFIFINFANADMVGHTAHYDATINAVEATDKALEKLVGYAMENKYTTIITADHGNAEINYDASENVKHTAHTTNPVPVIITATGRYAIDSGTLADVAPTVLNLLNLPVPASMTGKNLLK